MRSSYNTKQRSVVLDLIKNVNREFTINELYEELKGSVGLTTIYRLVDKLVLEGLLTKEVRDNNHYYLYVEKCNLDNHFYLKCDKCGKLIHIDCDCIKELTEHICNEHSFIPNKEHIIINGICSKCGVV